MEWFRYSQIKSIVLTTQSTSTNHGKVQFAKTQYRKFETNIPRKELHSTVPIPTLIFLWAIYMYIPLICRPILLQENMWTNVGIYRSLTETWMWKLGLQQRNSFSRKHKSKFSCKAAMLVLKSMIVFYKKWEWLDLYDGLLTRFSPCHT